MPDRIDADGTITTGPDLADAAAVAILIHGRGRSPGEMRGLAAALAVPGIQYVIPAAPGGTWYPEGFMAPAARNEPALSASLARYAELVDGLVADGVPPARIALGGFSQGACLTAEHLVRHPRVHGAVFILTGGLIGPPGTAWPLPALAGTPVYISGSKVDTWVPVDRVLETERHLRACGAAVRSRIFEDREHFIAEEEIDAVRPMLLATARR